jgi:hypothetical protein
MDSEPKPAADVVRRHIGLWQRIPITDKQAAAMARERQAYAAATEEVRATLSPGDQPANFAATLAAKGPPGEASR